MIILVQKGQYINMHLFTSSFVYLCQDLYTSKTRFEYTYQDLRIRIRFTYTYQDPLASTSSLINIDQVPHTRIDN